MFLFRGFFEISVYIYFVCVFSFNSGDKITNIQNINMKVLCGPNTPKDFSGSKSMARLPRLFQIRF